MKRTFKLDQSFGPAISNAGIILVLAGIYATQYGFAGLILVFIGLILALTRQISVIDFEHKIVTLSTSIIGVRFGKKEISIKETMQLSMRAIKNNWQINSLSNRNISINKRNFCIVLLDDNKNEIETLAMANKEEQGKILLNEISQKLNLSIHNTKAF